MRNGQVANYSKYLLSESLIDSIQTSSEFAYFKNEDSKLVRLSLDFQETIIEEEDQHYTGFIPETGSEITWMNFDGFLKRNNEQIYQVPACGFGRQLYKTKSGKYLACFGDTMDQGIWLLDETLNLVSTWSYKGSLPPIEHLYCIKDSDSINYILVQTSYKWYVVCQDGNKLSQSQEIKFPSEATTAAIYANKLLISGQDILIDANLKAID